GAGGRRERGGPGRRHRQKGPAQRALRGRPQGGGRGPRPGGPRRRRGAHPGRGQRVDGGRGSAQEEERVSPRSGLPRAPVAERQRRLKLVPLDLPPIESDEPPFLRPERRTRVRRTRRGLMWRLIVGLEVMAGLLVALFATWGAYSRVMAAERLKVAHLEVRGSHFLSEADVRDLLGPAL